MWLIHYIEPISVNRLLTNDHFIKMVLKFSEFKRVRNNIFCNFYKLNLFCGLVSCVCCSVMKGNQNTKQLKIRSSRHEILEGNGNMCLSYLYWMCNIKWFLYASAYNFLQSNVSHLNSAIIKTNYSKWHEITSFHSNSSLLWSELRYLFVKNIKSFRVAWMHLKNCKWSMTWKSVKKNNYNKTF